MWKERGLIQVRVAQIDTGMITNRAGNQKVKRIGTKDPRIQWIPFFRCVRRCMEGR